MHRQQQRIDFINGQLRLETAAETKFTELNNPMREYHEVFGQEHPPLPREPVLSDYYIPSNEQHDRVSVYNFKHDWNWRGFVVLRILNYIMTHYYNSYFLVPYTYRVNLQYLQPKPIDFGIPNPPHLQPY